MRLWKRLLEPETEWVGEPTEGGSVDPHVFGTVLANAAVVTTLGGSAAQQALAFAWPYLMHALARDAAFAATDSVRQDTEDPAALRPPVV